jgi:hypothetical protein
VPTARDSLLARIRQLERDPGVHRDVVRHFRGTLNDLEQAALEFREWERVRSAAESAEVSAGVLDGGLERPWLDTKSAAVILGCRERWVTQLCLTGRSGGGQAGTHLVPGCGFGGGLQAERQ